MGHFDAGRLQKLYTLEEYIEQQRNQIEQCASKVIRSVPIKGGDSMGDN